MRLKKLAQGLGVAALAVSLSGCMKMDMSLDIQSDEKINGEMIMAMDRGFVETLGQDPDDLFNSFGQPDDLPEGTETEPYEDDDFIGQKFSFKDMELSEFNESNSGGGLTITHEGDEFVVTGELDAGGLGDIPDLEGLDDAPMPGAEPGVVPPGLDDPEALNQMMGNFEITFSVTFPGKVVEHNGELDGTTVTWQPKIGENQTFEARGKDSPGFPTWAWFLIGLLAVGAVAVVLFRLSGKKDKPVTTDEGEPTSA